jgi:hypothetical protein
VAMPALAQRTPICASSSTMSFIQSSVALAVLVLPALCQSIKALYAASSLQLEVSQICAITQLLPSPGHEAQTSSWTIHFRMASLSSRRLLRQLFPFVSVYNTIIVDLTYSDVRNLDRNLARTPYL